MQKLAEVLELIALKTPFCDPPKLENSKKDKQNFIKTETLQNTLLYFVFMLPLLVRILHNTGNKKLASAGIA